MRPFLPSSQPAPSDQTPRALAAATSRGAAGRLWKNRLFFWLCIGSAAASVLVLVVLLASILHQGTPHLSTTFLQNGPDADPALAGIRPALFGTLWVCLLCALFTLPVGVATAILLEEYRPKGRYSRMIHGIVQLNISNLAGVPSVVYGILGLTAFVSMFGLFDRFPGGGLEFGVRHFDQFFSEGDRAILVPVAGPDAPETSITDEVPMLDFHERPVELQVLSPGTPLPEDPALREYAIYADAEPGRIGLPRWYHLRLPLGRSLVTASLTLMLVILPIVIISTQESLRAVSPSLRAGALGLGATHWQVVWNVTLPASVPGIMTGSILAMSRAIGEAAPILIIVGIVYIQAAPEHLMDSVTVMPLQIFNWAGRPQEAFHGIAAAGIIILVGALLVLNSVAVFIRNRAQNS